MNKENSETIPLAYKTNFESDRHFVNTCAKAVRDSFGSDFLTKDFFRVLFSFYAAHEKFLEKQWEVDSKYKPESPIQHAVNLVRSAKTIEHIEHAVRAIKRMANELNSNVFPRSCLHTGRFIEDIIGVEYESPTQKSILKNKEILSPYISDDDFGIYLLFNIDKQLLYIGKSKSILTRCSTSSAQRGAKYAAFILTETHADMHILEPYLIAVLKPTLNTDHSCEDLPTFEIEIPQMSELISLHHEAN